MQYYRKLYVSDTLQKKKEKILDKLEQGKPQFQVYLIVLAANRQNHLEFFDAMMLHQHAFRESEELFLVGIADGYGGAVELVEEIVTEVLNETGGMDIRGYIEHIQSADTNNGERQQTR